jgi:hypothetical protein
MEAVLSSGTSVNFYQITRYYIPEDGTLQGTYTLHRRTNSFYKLLYLCISDLYTNVYIYCEDIRYRSLKSICNAESIIIMIIIIPITVHDVAGIA